MVLLYIYLLVVLCYFLLADIITMSVDLYKLKEEYKELCNTLSKTN